MERQKGFKHVRHHDSILASAEKRLLVRIARRLPAWVNADHLSLLGVLAMLGVGLSFWAASWDQRALIFVVAGLVLNWFGDSLDGTLARIRKQQRPRYGYYVDHVLDLVGTLFLLGGLAASEFMNPVIGLGLLIAYLMVSAEIYLATHVLGVFRLSFLKVGPTELRLLLAAGTVFLFYKPVVGLGELGTFNLFDVGGLVGILGLVLTFTVSALRHTRKLYRAEPRPRVQPPLPISLPRFPSTGFGPIGSAFPRSHRDRV